LKAEPFRAGFLPGLLTVGNYSIGGVRKAVDNGQKDYYFETIGSPSTSNSEQGIVSDLDKIATVAPNPGSGNFYVDFGAIQDGFEISVINMVGQVVKVEKSLQPAKGSNLNLDGKKPGLYLVKVNYTSGKTSELKIVIQ
jgi:hypothetical protein